MPIAELGDSLRLCRRIAWHVFSQSNGINSFRGHRHPRGTANVQHSLIDPVLPDEKLDVDFVFFGESRADRQGDLGAYRVSLVYSKEEFEYILELIRNGNVKLHRVLWCSALNRNDLVKTLRLLFIVLFMHRELITEFFLEVGTTVNLVAIDATSSNCQSEDKKETDNNGSSHH